MRDACVDHGSQVSNGLGNDFREYLGARLVAMAGINNVTDGPYTPPY